MGASEHDTSADQLGAIRDQLTRVPGLVAVHERIAAWRREEALLPRQPHIHAMRLGLSRLDAINTAYGEAAGDGALEELAARISRFAEEELDGSWLLARAGGGSFVLVANETCSRERWQLLAEQLADLLVRPIAVPGGVLRLTPWIALIRALTEESVDSMLDRLSQTLEDAREHRGPRLAWVDGEAMPPGRTAAELETDLLGAVDRDEIEVLFQPQFDLATDRLVGAEALARWDHPRLGRIGAGALFAVAERTDQVAPLSRHIARKALAAASQWPENLRLSINVTPADLAFGSYVRQALDLVRDSGFPPHRLTLEVTEQSLINDVALSAQTMAELGANGIRFALDDFGAGFCNFRYLKVLPIRYLKLDRSMVEGIASDQRDMAVLRAIVAMARALDLEVIAEGIEHEEQRVVAAREGCAYFQGFLRAQPMSAAMFAKLARTAEQ